MMDVSRAEAAVGAETPDAALDHFDRLLVDFRRKLEEGLERFFAEKRRELPGGTEAAELANGIQRLVRGGGKRLRPALVYHTYRGCGGRLEAGVMRLAMSTELLHTYLLIHDDIMDHSELRRGLPSVHVEFQRRHRQRGWPGDGVDFGRSMAILIGDLAYAWAVDLYHQALRGKAASALPGELRLGLDRTFSGTCEEVVVGQYLEMHLPFRERPAERELLEVLRLKSGCYSVERPMQLGALLAGASAELLDTLRVYGAAVGEVFQLKDDILGVFGDAEKLGKPVGSDLIEGKFTFLIHETLRHTSPADSRKLQDALGSPAMKATDVKEVRDIIRSSGGLAAVRRMIEERLNVAKRALDKLAFEPDAHSFFAGLIAYSRDRDR